MHNFMTVHLRRACKYLSFKAHTLITFLKQKGDPSVY